MKGFLCAFDAECLKIRKRSKYLVFFLILLSCYALCVLLRNGSSETGIALQTVLMYLYLPLIAFMGANDLFASEIRRGSIVECIVKPVSRTDIYLAKCAAVLVNCAFHALLICALDTAVGFVSDGLGDHRQILYLVIDFVPLLSLVAFSCLVSFLITSPALSMLFCLVSYFGMLAAGMFASVSTVFFTSYLTWHTMFDGSLNFWGVIIRILMVAAPCVFFIASGTLAMERKRF